jgi:hypothetical protein
VEELRGALQAPARCGWGGGDYGSGGGGGGGTGLMCWAIVFFFLGQADLGVFNKRWQGVVIKLRDVDVSLDADCTV